MGVLTGFSGAIDTGAILAKRITLQGIYVGPVATLGALARIPIVPQIDRVFAFQDADEGYRALRGAAHFGKLVVRIGG